MIFATGTVRVKDKKIPFKVLCPDDSFPKIKAEVVEYQFYKYIKSTCLLGDAMLLAAYRMEVV